MPERSRRYLEEDERELGAAFVLEVFLVIALLAAASWYALGGSAASGGHVPPPVPASSRAPRVTGRPA